MIAFPGRAARGAVALLACFALTGTQCSQTVTDPPGQWSVVNTFVNANSPDSRPGDARTTVFFSRILWQETNPRAAYYAYGWMNDVLVKSPYAFQIELTGAQFLRDGLILKDVASGRELTARQARVNASRNCGPLVPSNDPVQPQQPSAMVQCYLEPWQPTYIQRPALPANETSWTVELVQVCRGQPRYTDLRCPTTPNGDPNGPQAPLDAILLLTIAPHSAPAAPVHGQKFEYELIARTSAGESRTRLTAVYVESGLCRLTSLQAVPPKGPVGSQVNVQWFAQECRSVEVTTSDAGTPTLSSQLAPAGTASQPNMNGSRPFQLGSLYDTITFTAVAHDSMGREAAKRTATVNVEPCSISPTHPRCESRCQVTPAPAGCPQPPPPACPVGEGDSNRQVKNFTVRATCIFGPQWVENRVVTEPACTEAQAQQSVRAQLGPSCTVVSGPPVSRECPNGAQKRDWKFCLRCSNSGTHDTTARACYLDEAVEAAKLNRPNDICWLQQEGICPK